MSNFRENSAKICKSWKILNLQKLRNFKKLQLDNLVDFENCCKTRIHLQRSASIQPKTSEIMPKICNRHLSLRPSQPTRTIMKSKPTSHLKMMHFAAWNLPFRGMRPAHCAGLNGGSPWVVRFAKLLIILNRNLQRSPHHRRYPPRGELLGHDFVRRITLS